MKQVSTKFQNKMQENLRSWVPRMTINGTEISGDIQAGLTISLGSCGAEEFNIGTVFIPSITATISDCSTVLQNKEIKLEMGLVLEDGTIEYVPVGYFTVEKPNKGKFATSFTAYGRLMSKMGGMYESTLTYPTAINNVLSEISSKTGVTIKLSGLTGTSSVPLKPTGLNYREAVQLMAGLLGGFVTENSSGEIVICKYQLNDALTVDTSFCYEYPFVYDEKYAVTGLSVKTDNAEFSYGTPNISMSNGYMNAALFEVCKNNIMGFSYMPGSVHFLGDIRLDPWDSLKVTDDDEVYQIPCMDIVHVWDGGLITTINAPGTTEAEDGSGFEGSLKIIEDKISGIDGVTAAIKTLFEIDKIHGTIKLQAGKLLEILSGGTFIVDAENYKLNEDGTVTITGGTIGGFKIDDTNITKYNRYNKPILIIDGSDFPCFSYSSGDSSNPQSGYLGWYINPETGTICHGLMTSSTDVLLGTDTTEVSGGVKVMHTSTDGEQTFACYGNQGIWTSNGIFTLDDEYVATITRWAMNSLINKLPTGTVTPEDEDYLICQYAGGNTQVTGENNTYLRKKMSALWKYIKSKTDNVYAPSDHKHNGETLSLKSLFLSDTSGATTTTANARIGTASPNIGKIMKTASSSSKRYKHDIAPLSDELSADKLYDIEVVQFKYNDDYLNKNDIRFGLDLPGFIAEQVHEAYPIAADIENDAVETWNERFIIPPMLKLIQDQKRQIDLLEERIEKLEQMLVK